MRLTEEQVHELESLLLEIRRRLSELKLTGQFADESDKK